MLIGARHTIATKSDVIAALLAAVDSELLGKAPQRSEDQQRRDQLFDTIMTRFDILAPYKPALKSIARSGSADLRLAGPLLSSQYWMLTAAGIPTHGAAGGRPEPGEEKPLKPTRMGKLERDSDTSLAGHELGVAVRMNNAPLGRRFTTLYPEIATGQRVRCSGETTGPG